MIYELTQEAKEIEKKRFEKSLPWLSISFLPSIFIILFPNIELATLLIGISLFFCMLGYYFIRSSTNRRLSIRISLNDDQLSSLINGSPYVTIKRDEVKKIIEIPNEGLRVDSTNYPQAIFIPIDIEGYQLLKTTIASWSIPVEPSKKEFRNLIIVIYGTLVIIITAILLKNKIFWILTCTLCIGLLSFNLIHEIIFRKGWAKWAPIIVPVLIAIILFILLKYHR